MHIKIFVDTGKMQVEEQYENWIADNPDVVVIDISLHIAVTNTFVLFVKYKIRDY